MPQLLWARSRLRKLLVLLGWRDLQCPCEVHLTGIMKEEKIFWGMTSKATENDGLGSYLLSADAKVLEEHPLP